MITDARLASDRVFAGSYGLPFEAPRTHEE